MKGGSSPPERAAAADLPGRRFRQYLVVAVGLVAAMSLGLVAQSILAYYFGAGADTDALFMARDIAEFATKLLLPTQAIGVLVPMFLAMQLGRSQNALAFVSALMWTVLTPAVPLVVAVIVFAPELVTAFAPGFDDATSHQTATLLRYLAPTAWFVVAGSFAVAILQARERFGVAMLSNVAGQAAAAASLPPMVIEFGLTGASLGLLLGAGVQWALSWALLLREGMPPFGNPLRHQLEIRRFARRTFPFLAYAGMSQGSAIVYRISASTLISGAFAALSFGHRLYRAVFSLIFLPIQIVLFPALARHEAEGRPQDLTGELRASLRHVVYIVTPVVVATVLLRTELVSLVFERGDFTAEATADTSLALAVFALGLLPAGSYALLEQASYARRRTRLVLKTIILAECVQASLYFPLTLVLGIAGIPTAALIGATVATLVYIRGLYPGSMVRGLRTHGGYILRVVLCAATMAVAIAGATALVKALVDPEAGLAQGAIVVPAMVAGVGAYLAMSAVLRLREPRVLSGLFLGSVSELVGRGVPGKGRAW